MKRIQWILIACLCGPGSAGADAPPAAETEPPAAAVATEELTVDLTCILPAEGPPVAGGQLVARLYEYHPRLADRAATEIARVTLSGVVHRPGAETVLRFPCAGQTAERKAYYLTAVVYPQAMTEGQSGLYFINGFQRVLADGSSQELRIVLTPVDPGTAPTN